ncbi:hypothetical protein VSS74_15775 [Conexibacter stalactiti]|uniref:Uncharacterized protein n=1 Tax=Conexibacter stalactiti TaxID=1940611 RepID=A0ABU4HT03_9ACTN|nr:hypothetical protein [Conexibacter stalactiti]MDW5595807.1 hypothetical protein [Conexibacter stalactiti]MEC5036449.1 hypothetical protein [Conexibacter stalactiti]
MVFRLFLAGACALALATASAGSALADVAPPTRAASAELTLSIPAAVQVWTPAGFVYTIPCRRLSTHPACDPGQWPGNTRLLLKEYGGYRFLARSGRWFEYGGTEATVETIERVDAEGGPGATDVIQDPSELDPWDPRGAVR